MSFINSTVSRPSRLDDQNYPNKDKNKQYHLDFAKWAASSAQNYQYYQWLENVRINKKYYKGDQWENEEDLEAFLKDSTGQERNRIKVVHNLIKPMVEQFRGNAIRLSINATAKSISPMAKNRREEALQKKLLKSEVASALPNIGRVLLENDPTITDDPYQTEEIFNNLYTDVYTENINELINYSESLNRLPNMKSRLAQSMALSGMAVTECYNHGGHRRYAVLEPEDFIFDRDAREYDLSDATFMGKRPPMDPSAIFEKYPKISKEEREVIESQSSQDSSGEIYSDNTTGRKHSTNRIPVYEIYWKDVETYEYGYVEDEYGYPALVKINHIEDGETEPKYTDKHLIDYPQTSKNISIFGSKKKRNLVVDVLRFCAFIPAEFVPNRQSDAEQKASDIVLDFGMAEYQDTDYMDVSNVKFPFKAHCWAYVDGEVFSPIDDAINPQRFINRVMSVFESQINNSGGAGVIIDEDAVDPNGKDDIYHDISEGKPITVRTKGRGVPNTVGVYDATPKSGTMGMLDIIPMMKNMIQETTGVNEALKGESTGSDQLVGVTQLLIQRGSLMQEPFYDGLANVFMQIYQDMATVGKRYYIDNERELAIAIGDEGVKTLKLSKELKNEDFRVFISRDNDDQMLQNQANQILSTFMEAQLINKNTFLNLYGRSTPDQVLKKVREEAKLQSEIDRRQAQAEAQAADQAAQAESAQIEQMQAQEKSRQMESAQIVQAQQDRQNQHEIQKIQEKGLVDLTKEMAKSNEKEANI